jgi:hypothetical protein
MYEIYCLTFNTTGKQYIGFTGKGVMNRIHKHYINASYGIDSHLYRAIRMYGLENVSIEILYQSSDKNEALKMEKYYITKFDAIKNGYNETHGGAGGWSVPEHKLESWKKSIVKRTQGLNNPNSKSVTNQQILDQAVEFYKNNGNKLTRVAWFNYCKEHGLPVTYTKFRFGGGYDNFLKALKDELDRLNIHHNDKSFTLSYEERYKKEYNIKISNTLKEKYAKNQKNRP